MAEYQLTSTEPDTPVIRTEDGACIPPDPANRDWVNYQQWLADGGIPDPPIPQPEPQAVSPDAVAWSDAYKASVTVGTAPTEGMVVWDAGTQYRATQVTIARVNTDGSDMAGVLSTAMRVGRVLRIEDRRNADRFVSHDIVDDAVVNGDNIAVAVATRANNGNAFIEGNLVSVTVYIAPPLDQQTGTFKV